MIPLSTPDLRGREKEYLARCVDDNWVSTAGPFVTDIEQRVAKMCDASFAVATVNGTTALQIALTAAGVKPGDHVVVPDWTFAATVNAIIHAGGIPVFVDISEENLTLSVNATRSAFKALGNKIRAVVAVHVLGRAPNMVALQAICEKHGALLIEDAAGAFGAHAHGRAAGCYGDAGIFSFNGNKIATAGGGGMIVTDDEGIAKRARHLCQQSRVGKDYVHDDVGFNYRMTNVNAAIGLAQLERLDEMKARRLQIQRRYDDALFPSNVNTPLPTASWDEPYCWLYSIKCGEPATAAALAQYLMFNNIESRVFWRALSGQKPYAKYRRFGERVADSVSGCIVSLPCSSHLTDADQDTVITTLKAWDRAA